MDFYSNSDEQKEKVNEYKESGYPTRQEVKKEREEREHNQRSMGREKENTDEEDETRVNSPSRTSKKRMKMKMPRPNLKLKLVFKILAIAAAFFNFKFILNFMKEPFSPFYHTLFVVGICIAINFIAVWILFHKSSYIRFYLSLFAILGSFGYYLYVNYTNQSFLGNNLITSVLVGITVLMAINPKVNYYLKSFVFLVVPIIGIYVSGNKFALVWTLMCNAGLLLFFRISKSNKKEDRTKRNQKQTA
ncbi:hypothetical protein [Bacillus sp. EB600]|uniref:hypothetical protein n=1 Tax=Bacillus sp. EB600 TaxID=2806345 RepID=UPI00210A5D28|nr:hypothetical protein [Bacillus sp. EB600]MCQ6282787.1 hypothetical protein [Bacillus sp. EB600]